MEAAISLVLKGVFKLRTRYKNEKINEKESALLEDFVKTIERCISATQKVGASSSSSTKKSKPLPLVVTLKEVQETLDEWSSEGSRFFWMFTDRTQKLEALKLKVDRALWTHNLEILLQIHDKVVAHPEQKPKQPPKVKDEKDTSTRDSRSSNKGKQRKEHQRSASAEPPRKAPPENHDVGSKDSNDQGPIHPPDSKLKPKTHTWVSLWAPLDSEKQSKDVEEKLKNIRDVEKVRCDQPTKKVRVKVKAVEVKDDSKIIKTLLRETKDALPSFKVLPTLWKNRPK